MGGWVKLWRDIQDHPVWEDPVTLKVFLWCVIFARRIDQVYRGDRLQPGQFTTGRNAAAVPLGLTPSSVNRAFRRLEKMGCITVEANRTRTIVTVCNWSTYQGADDDSEQDPNRQRTSVEQAANTIRREGKKERIKNSPLERRADGAAATPGKTGSARFDPLTLASPPELSGSDFAAAWKLLVDHRRQLKKPFTEASAKSQLKKLASIGVDRAVAAIEHSVAEGWHGVFEPKDCPAVDPAALRSAPSDSGTPAANAHAGPQARRWKPSEPKPAPTFELSEIETAECFLQKSRSQHYHDGSPLCDLESLAIWHWSWRRHQHHRNSGVWLDELQKNLRQLASGQIPTDSDKITQSDRQFAANLISTAVGREEPA